MESARYNSTADHVKSYFIVKCALLYTDIVC